MMKNEPYYDLSNLTSKYFDLGGRMFLDDLIVCHLGINPKKLNIAELKDLLIWLEIITSLVIEDQKIVQDYISGSRKIVEAKQ